MAQCWNDLAIHAEADVSWLLRMPAPMGAMLEQPRHAPQYQKQVRRFRPEFAQAASHRMSVIPVILVNQDTVASRSDTRV